MADIRGCGYIPSEYTTRRAFPRLSEPSFPHFRYLQELKANTSSEPALQARWFVCNHSGGGVVCASYFLNQISEYFETQSTGTRFLLNLVSALGSNGFEPSSHKSWRCRLNLLWRKRTRTADSGPNFGIVD